MHDVDLERLLLQCSRTLRLKSHVMCRVTGFFLDAETRASAAACMVGAISEYQNMHNLVHPTSTLVSSLPNCSFTPGRACGGGRAGRRCARPSFLRPVWLAALC